jgi:hypothetical protein
MPLPSVPAVYDGTYISLLEAPPYRVPYHVLVTFVKPVEESPATEKGSRFWRSFGAWQDDRPVEATLEDIHAARRSRPEPPAL